MTQPLIVAAITDYRSAHRIIKLLKEGDVCPAYIIVSPSIMAGLTVPASEYMLLRATPPHVKILGVPIFTEAQHARYMMDILSRMRYGEFR